MSIHQVILTLTPTSANPEHKRKRCGGVAEAEDCSVSIEFEIPFNDLEAMMFP